LVENCDLSIILLHNNAREKNDCIFPVSFKTKSDLWLTRGRKQILFTQCLLQTDRQTDGKVISIADSLLRNAR